MSFTCKNCNTSLTAGQAAPVTPSLSASTPPAKKANSASVAAVLLAVVIGIMGLASAGCGNQPSTSSVQVSPQPQVTQTDPTPSPANIGNESVPDLLHLASASASPAASRPSGVLTFTGHQSGDEDRSLLDYNIATQVVTNCGRGEDGYRAKNGIALVKDIARHVNDNHSDLVLISADGKTRTTVVDDYSKFRSDFILSPDGRTVIYGTTIDDHDASNDLVSSNVLAIHDVETGKDRIFQCGTPGRNAMGHPVPQDWMQDGSLLITPSDELNVNPPSGEPLYLNFTFIAKDFSGLINYSTIVQPASKPVKQIFDPRINRSGKRIAFAWDHHIWVANYDGHALASEAKQVTESDSSESWPAWSPDGKWLAVGHIINGSAVMVKTDFEDIYLVPVDGNKHNMNDPDVIELKEKGKGRLTCFGRITWR